MGEEENGMWKKRGRKRKKMEGGRERERGVNEEADRGVGVMT